MKILNILLLLLFVQLMLTAYKQKKKNWIFLQHQSW